MKMIKNITINYDDNNEKYYLFIDNIMHGKFYGLPSTLKCIERIVNPKIYLVKVRKLMERRNKMKGTPKHDGTGKGTRVNKGRGGCKTTEPTGKGK